MKGIIGQILLTVVWVAGAFMALNSENEWLVMGGVLLVAVISNIEGAARARDD